MHPMILQVCMSIWVCIFVVLQKSFGTVRHPQLLVLEGRIEIGGSHRPEQYLSQVESSVKTEYTESQLRFIDDTAILYNSDSSENWKTIENNWKLTKKLKIIKKKDKRKKRFFQGD